MEIAHRKVWNEYLRLAALTREDMIRIALVSVMISMIFVIFHFQGNTTNLKLYGQSVFSWMLGRWQNMGGDFSHGWLIPLVSVGIVWFKRRDLADAPKKVSKLGLTIVILALLTHWLGAKAQQTRISLMGFIMLVWGIPFYLYGWQVAKILIFPSAYLIFAIPMNFLDSMTFPLRVFATIVSTVMLNGLGIAAQRVGTGIQSVAAGGFNFDVADPCSGLRSLLAMTALTAVYAYLTQQTLLKKWILFLCSIPLAIVGNVARITTVGLVAEAFGEKLALGLYHDYSGYVVFSVAIGLMIATGSLLKMDYGAFWLKWKQKLSSPTS